MHLIAAVQPFVLGALSSTTESSAGVSYSTFHSRCACKTVISEWGCLKGSQLAETHVEIYLRRDMLCKWEQQKNPRSILVFKSRSIKFIIKFSIKAKLPTVSKEHTQWWDTEKPGLKCKKLCCCLVNIYYSNYPHFVAKDHKRKKKSQNYVCRQMLTNVLHFSGHCAEQKNLQAMHKITFTSAFPCTFLHIKYHHSLHCS